MFNVKRSREIRQHRRIKENHKTMDILWDDGIMSDFHVHGYVQTLIFSKFPTVNMKLL